MFRIRGTSRKCILTGWLALAMIGSLDSAHAREITVLHSFVGGTDGMYPNADLIRRSKDLYGTTGLGGGSGCGGYGCGTVFRIAPDGTETVLHAFSGGSDGSGPFAGVIADRVGNLYGTTCGGSCGGHDAGTVFRLSPDGALTVLYAFTGGRDGAYPYAGLLRKADKLYGTTYGGGAYNSGTVFKLAPGGAETVLHAFSGGSDGNGPAGSLITDATGNLYGTTVYGGGSGCGGYGCGTVFRIAPDGTETLLHAFADGNDGAYPSASLIADTSGNLYGTTYGGGVYRAGTVFKLAPDGTETVLYAFSGGNDGSGPSGRLIRDSAGNFYSTTGGGGAYTKGTIFKLATDGTETVLYAFCALVNCEDGTNPQGGLTADKKGNLYGTTLGGGSSYIGTVFKFKAGIVIGAK